MIRYEYTIRSSGMSRQDVVASEDFVMKFDNAAKSILQHQSDRGIQTPTTSSLVQV